MKSPFEQARPGQGQEDRLGPLVVVSGLPAAGKSTLSSRLGHDLGFPVIHRDRLRRYIFGGFHAIEEARTLLPAAGDRLVIGTISAIVRAGVGAVLDGNFNTERHMTPVRELLADSGMSAVEICLWGDTEELRRRFIDRADPPLTADLEPYFEEVLHRDREAVLSDSEKVRHVDTTDLQTLEAAYPSLLDWARTTLA